MLEVGEDGQNKIDKDGCNQLELSAVKVTTEAAKLSVEMALNATTGANMFGACRGPKPWQGNLVLELTPKVTESGLAIEFVPDSIKLLRPDNSPSMLNRPAQLIADALVLPRMKSVKIDLAGPLSSLDDLIEQLLNPDSREDDSSSLVQLTRIIRVQMEETGVKAWLAFQVRPSAIIEHAPEPILDTNELAQWQTLEDEFDGFLTTIITALAQSTNSSSLRLELLGVLLDTRYAIADALTVDNPESDPVRQLFILTWERLRPLMTELENLQIPGLEADFKLAGFIAGGDALTALDALGPEYGLEITRDGLRRLARLLLAEGVPPSFTPLPLEVDPEFRDLFGFDVQDEEALNAKTFKSRFVSSVEQIGSWLLPVAHAESISPAVALKGLIPQRDNLDDYLDLVASLLHQQSNAWLAENKKMPNRLVKRLDPLVRATAWKESCWRQFTGSSKNPKVLRSSGGAVGMMQFNGRVWRKVYDLDRLIEEVDYNVSAGIDILTHYMIDYAIRRGEHEQPGGDDNLIKATYAAYNGGPGHLARYRREDTPAQLKAIDNTFWDYYTTFKSGQLPNVAKCYVLGN